MSDAAPIMSAEMAKAIALSSTILSGISMFFCLLILLAAAWVYSVGPARREISRVSFRLMLWSMFFGIGYDLCYILLYPNPAVLPGSRACKVVMYWQVVTIGAVNYFCTCIAVNLMLSICFAFNPTRFHLERWYIGVSLLLAFGVPIVPTALGLFGEDPVYASCYFTSPDLKTRLMHFIVDLYLWQIISTLIACGAVIATLVTLFHSGRTTARALLNRGLSDEETGLSGEFGLTEEKAHRPTFKEKISTTCSQRNQARRESPYSLQERFVGIAFRISLYPVVMIIMNTVLTVGDMYLSTRAVTTRAELGLYTVYYTLYGARNIFIAMIGIFVDTCLLKGIKVAWQVRFPYKTAGRQPNLSTENSGHLDFASALAALPYTDGAEVPTFDRSGSRKGVLPPSSFSRSFNGVESGSLPSGMTDDVDVDVDLVTKLETVGEMGMIDIPSVLRVNNDGSLAGGGDVSGPLGHPTPPIGSSRSTNPGVEDERARRRKERRETVQHNFEDLIHRL